MLCYCNWRPDAITARFRRFANGQPIRLKSSKLLNQPTPPPAQHTPRLYNAAMDDPSKLPKKDMLSYEVRRITQSGWLPVYREFKKNRTQVWTYIRNVRGNSEALVDDLADKVAPRHRISVKKVSGHVVLLGDYLHDVRDFLTARKF